MRVKKLFKNFQWKAYFISSLIVSFCAFVIHFKDYPTPSINLFLMWLPVVWLMVFIMGFSFTLFFGGND